MFFFYFYAPVEFWLDRFCLNMRYQQIQAILLYANGYGYRTYCTQCLLKEFRGNPGVIKYYVELSRKNAREGFLKWTNDFPSWTGPDFPVYADSCKNTFPKIADEIRRQSGTIADSLWTITCYPVGVGDCTPRQLSYVCPHVPAYNVNVWHATNHNAHLYDFYWLPALYLQQDPVVNKIYRRNPRKIGTDIANVNIEEAYKREIAKDRPRKQ